MSFEWLKSKSFILLLAFSLLLPFQNCAVYESEERKEFNSLLDEASSGGCYPYIDTNIAMSYMGAIYGLDAYMNKVEEDDANICSFMASGAVVINAVICEISRASALNLAKLKTSGTAAFPNTLAVWTATTAQVNSGFTGSHGGYVASGADGKYSIKYLALNGSDFKGVECTFKALPATWTANSAAIKVALSKMATEMSLNNRD